MRAYGVPLTDEMVGAFVWLNKVALTHHLRVNADGVGQACARVGAGAFSGLLLRLRSWVLRRREVHEACHFSSTAFEISKRNKYMYIHIRLFIYYIKCVCTKPLTLSLGADHTLNLASISLRRGFKLGVMR